MHYCTIPLNKSYFRFSSPLLLVLYKDVISKFLPFVDQVSAAAAAASESGLSKSNCDDPLKSIEESEDGSTGNPVGQLQEFCVKHGLPMPVYDLGSVDGQPHQVKKKIRFEDQYFFSFFQNQFQKENKKISYVYFAQDEKIQAKQNFPRA